MRTWNFRGGTFRVQYAAMLGVLNAAWYTMHVQSSQRTHQSLAGMRREMEYGELYVKTSRTQGQDRLNSAVAPPKEFKESLEEILNSLLSTEIHTCNFFHEMGNTCACVRPRVHVFIHRAVSIAPLAESCLVFVACECCMRLSPTPGDTRTNGRAPPDHCACRDFAVQIPLAILDKPDCE